MIKVQNMVPEVYYKESRDFQLLGRLFEMLFNYAYNNVQIMSKNVNSIENNTFLLELLCSSLGFDIKQEYDSKQLNAISSIFLEVLKNKGNIKSIQLLVNLILNITGYPGTVTINFDDDGILNIFVPSDVLDLNLFNEVLNYTLPAGTLYNIRQSEVIETTLPNENYRYNETITPTWIHDKDLVTRDSTTGVNHPNSAEKIAYFTSDETSE